MPEATPQNGHFEPEKGLEKGQNSVEKGSFEAQKALFDLEKGSFEAQKALFDLENRVLALENDRDRFLKALRGAVEMLLENPMATAMMPKQMKEDLRRYIKEAS